MRLAPIFIITLLTIGCSKSPVAVHPGAISNLDSYSYDVLLVEQDAINQAKAAYLANSLPAEAKAPLNAAIAQYNTAEAAWQEYHAFGSNQTKLQQAMDALVTAVGALQQVLHKSPTPVSPTGTLFIMEAPYVYATSRAS